MFDDKDSSDENDESLSKQVLPTAAQANEPVDMNKMPTTGEEYLRQKSFHFPCPGCQINAIHFSDARPTNPIRNFSFQASQLPDFRTTTREKNRATTASNSRNHAWHKLFSTTAGTPNVTKDRIVSLDWQNEQCQSFSDTRNDYFRMRDRIRLKDRKPKLAKLKTASHYWRFCFGDDIPFQTPLASLETNDDQQQIANLLPTMTKMSTLNQPQMHELLQYEHDWLKQGGGSVHLALYIFATLVAIEKPVSDDEIYTMRQICIGWKNIRAKLLNSTDTERLSDESLTKCCDLFVCLVGRYFGQFDLADATD